MDSVWDWFEYEIRMRSGQLFVSTTTYNEPGDALDSAIDRALPMEDVIESIEIVSADYDEYVM